MVLFKILDAKHADYSANQIKRLDLLYKGGYDIASNVDMFLRQLASETPASFEDRKKCVSYLPYMSDIIDNITSSLFKDEISISEASDADNTSTMGDEADDESVYKLFFQSADSKGKSLEEALRCIMTDALIHKKAYVGIDFPVVNETPINLLEEEVLQSGRPYLYYIDPECVIDWLLDEDGKFIWIRVKSDIVVQPSPLVPPMHKLEYKVWERDNDVGKWEIYRTKELKLDKCPAPNDDIPMVASGTTSFKEIPILTLELPAGLALGNKIGPICEEIFQRTSILVNNENKSLNAMRVVFLGDEQPAPGGPIPSMTQENPFRHLSLLSDWESKGIAVLGANDKMEVIESEGHAFKIVSEQIDGLIEKLKEVVHQMASSASSHTKALGRSASSKQEDRISTEILLTAYGNLLRDFIKQIMVCISTARGESIVWTVDGLDNFSIIDRDQLILEAKQFSGITDASKSLTFSRLYTEKVYLALLDGSSHEDALAIREEIMNSIDEESIKVSEQNSVEDSKPASKTVPQSPVIGKSGNLSALEGSHLQTGQHIDSAVVHDQLAEDYKESDIEWVLNIPWIGPMEVPLSSIDFSNKDNWNANSEDEKVKKFADKIANEGFDKPIILVNSPSNNNKMIIVDGHHRALAYAQNKQAALAFVGQVGQDNGPWDKLHSKQVGSKIASLSSNQK